MAGMFKGILVIVCFAGYINYFVNVKRYSIFVVPAVVVTSVSGCLYIAGLINIMPLFVYLILGTGIFLLIYYRKDIKIKAAIKEHGFAVFLCAVLFAYLLYFTAGGVYEDGDTMTHWGIIVKTMYYGDRFPNFTDTVISYQSYPPATACWIYFILKLFGYGEGKALFAQGFWMLSCAISLFSLNKSKRKAWDLVTAILALFLMQNMGGLLVDTILSLVVIACFVLISEHRSDKRMLLISVLPFSIVIPLIKNSGMLFAFFLLVIMYLLIYKQNGWRNALKLCGIPAAVSIAGWYLWEAHIKMVYVQANATRHSLSIGYMKEVFGEKTGEDIRTIIQKYMATWLSWNDSYEWQAVILLVVIAGLCVFACGKRAGLFPGVVLAEYIIYKICLLIMYLVNMPGSNALAIASYSRYQKTFSLIMIALAVWMVFEYIIPAKENSLFGKISFFAIFAVTALLMYRIPYTELLRPDYQNGGNHRKLVKMMNEGNYGLRNKDKVVVYDDYWLNFHFVCFTFNNQACDSFTDITAIEEVLATNEKQYKYLIILEWNQEIKELLKKYGYMEDSECIKLQSD